MGERHRRKREKVLYLTRERERKNVPYRRERNIEHSIDWRERKRKSSVLEERDRQNVPYKREKDSGFSTTRIKRWAKIRFREK